MAVLNAAHSASDGFDVLPTDEKTTLTSSKALNLRELTAILYRSRWWIISIVFACVLVAVAYSLLATKLYDATVTVEVREEAEKVLGTEADREAASGRGDADRFLQTQLDIIRSRGVATAVAQSLGLFRGDDFFDRMKVHVPEVGPNSKVSLEEMRRESVLGILQKNLKVEFTGNTRIAALRFRSPDSELSTEIANSYADSYIRNNLKRKFSSSTYALDYLRGQLKDSQLQLEKSEADVLRFSRDTRIVDASAATAGSADNTRPQSLITAQLVQLNQLYSSALADRIQAEQRWQQIEGLPLMSIPDVLSNSAVQTVLAQRAQAQANYDRQLQEHREDYPSVKESHAQVLALSAQLASIGGDIRRSIRTPYTVALAREQEVREQLEHIKSSTLTEQNQGIQLSILRRQADTDRQQYETLLRRYNALNAEAGVQTNNLSIVDRADVSRAPSWPKLPLLLAISVAAGLVLSAIAVVIRGQLFDAVRTPDDVTDRLGMSLMGAVPLEEDAKIALADPKSRISEAYGSIRTALSFSSEHGLPRTLMVTSTQASEGKSTACYALATSLGRAGLRVLVIDADIRRPNLHHMFDAPNEIGLTNVLSGQTLLDQAKISIPATSIDILTSGAVAPNPSEMIGSNQLVRLIAEAAEAYDIVVVDSAPVLALADAVILSTRVEATIFVVESGRNTVRNVAGAVNRLLGADANIVGAILSKFDPGRLGYGTGADYAYTYRYQYGDETQR